MSAREDSKVFFFVLKLSESSFSVLEKPVTPRPPLYRAVIIQFGFVVRTQLCFRWNWHWKREKSRWVILLGAGWSCRWTGRPAGDRLWALRCSPSLWWGWRCPRGAVGKCRGGSRPGSGRPRAASDTARPDCPEWFVLRWTNRSSLGQDTVLEKADYLWKRCLWSRRIWWQTRILRPPCAWPSHHRGRCPPRCPLRIHRFLKEKKKHSLASHPLFLKLFFKNYYLE